jgi:hypothetical protein
MAFSILKLSITIANDTQLIIPFDVGVTFEMREPNTEKSIFRLIKIAVSQHLLNERGKGKVAERQRERGREHIETHMVNGMGIKQCGGVFD